MVETKSGKNLRKGELVVSSSLVDLGATLESRVGQKTAAKLRKFNLETVHDLLYFSPRKIQTWAELSAIEDLCEGKEITFLAEVIDTQTRTFRNRPGAMLTVILHDGGNSINATFFARHRGMLNTHARILAPGTRHLFSGKVSAYRGSWQLTHPLYDDASELSEEQAQERAKRPIPIYPQTAGLPSWVTQRAVATVLNPLREGDIPQVLSPELQEKWEWTSTLQALRGLHQPATKEEWYAARKRLAFDEALITQTTLARLRNAYNQRKAPVCSPIKDGIYEKLLRALPWELTDSQKEVGKQISQDMGSALPMQRLLQGDVGSGKTIVATLAMTRAVDSGKQAAMLAPTEVLARQHYRTIGKMMGSLAGGDSIFADADSIPLLLLTGSLSAPEKRRVLGILASGQPAIVIGTHALLSEGVQIPHLGLVVVDEQHRFGVEQRELLREKSDSSPHLLVMTATPIPRTVAMTIFGDLEVSKLASRPRPGKEIKTYLVPAENERWMERLWERAEEEIKESGQIYVVCPRISADAAEDESVSEIAILTAEKTELAAAEEVAQYLVNHPSLGKYGVGLLHGRMPNSEKEQVMADFNSGKIAILVSTTVIEVGVDNPNATMMVIMDAQQFGLSALHQLRGRVGRGSKPGICMAVYKQTQADISRERLEVFAQTLDGFKLADADLALRREGDVLGSSQAGRSSGLKFLSVAKDEKIIEKARITSRQIISSDPDLKNHQDLARSIEVALKQEQQENLLRS
ncbi:ATP-dependent DNA helicase RecG [Actinomycetaceae bacterium TAE3-ERU4]|nr:ATP-dependent DNA helicase RecG [Actinomycetaceae bacterium TAE3-ERU4]